MSSKSNIQQNVNTVKRNAMKKKGSIAAGLGITKSANAKSAAGRTAATAVTARMSTTTRGVRTRMGAAVAVAIAIVIAATIKSTGNEVGAAAVTVMTITTMIPETDAPRSKHRHE